MQQMPRLLWVLLFLCRRAGTRHHNTVSNISVSRLRYSVNHNALDSWPIRAHLASQNDKLCKIDAFQKVGHRGATIMYSMWKIMCFLNLKPHKHIALHQIHKIMFFLATSYDPFNIESSLNVSCNMSVLLNTYEQMKPGMSTDSWEISGKCTI